MNNDNKSAYFDFVTTKDGSTGLFNRKINDIYHSSYGAKNEAQEKFITPLNFEQNFLKREKLKVLDICFGIGYNTKAFLEKICETKYSQNISIDILEQDKNLALLSPFLKDGFFENTPEISELLIEKLFKQMVENENWISSIIQNENNENFIEPFYKLLDEKRSDKGYNCNLNKNNNSFLHNIYYHCISQRNKTSANCLRYSNFELNAYFDDARTTVQTLDGGYDVIFLDAFTPSKLPTLWSLQFFTQLYRLLSDDGALVTYSNSAAIRHAMIKSGFFVGKTFDENNRNCGTIASKDSAIIINKLDDYDLGLIKTNAGVYFIDKNLNSTPEEILSDWQQRKYESGLQSSSSYIKNAKRSNGYV